MVAIRNGTPHDLSDVYEADQTAWIKCCCGFRRPELAEGEVSMQLSSVTASGSTGVDINGCTETEV